jgi:hypothetical protein
MAGCRQDNRARARMLATRPQAAGAADRRMWRCNIMVLPCVDWVFTRHTRVTMGQDCAMRKGPSLAAERVTTKGRGEGHDEEGCDHERHDQ